MVLCKHIHHSLEAEAAGFQCFDNLGVQEVLLLAM